MLLSIILIFFIGYSIKMDIENINNVFKNMKHNIFWKKYRIILKSLSHIKHFFVKKSNGKNVKIKLYL